MTKNGDESLHINKNPEKDEYLKETLMELQQLVRMQEINFGKNYLKMVFQLE